MRRVVYGAPNTRLGAVTNRIFSGLFSAGEGGEGAGEGAGEGGEGAGEQLCGECDSERGRAVSGAHPFHSVHVDGGVMADECGGLMQRFFRQRRLSPRGDEAAAPGPAGG